MKEGQLKKHVFTSNQIYWVLECCPDKVGVSEADDDKIMDSKGFVPIEDLDEAKKDYPMPNLTNMGGIEEHITKSLSLCAKRQEWFLKWFVEK